MELDRRCAELLFQISRYGIDLNTIAELKF